VSWIAKSDLCISASFVEASEIVASKIKILILWIFDGSITWIQIHNLRSIEILVTKCVVCWHDQVDPVLLVLRDLNDGFGVQSSWRRVDKEFFV
jgi:hypothetical protein